MFSSWNFFTLALICALVMPSFGDEELFKESRFFFPIPWITVPTTTTTTTTTTTSATPALSTESIKFMSYFTIVQNAYRRVHSANTLTQNNALATTAQTCVNSYVTQTVAVPPGNPVTIPTRCGQTGEIAYYGTRTTNEVTGDQVATAILPLWYDNEKLTADLAAVPDPFSEHFTQMVWKASTEYGCAVAFNNIPAGQTGALYFISCIYNPPGNTGTVADYAANVQIVN